ncbi:MAG TPA: tRNA lysidine(34) synthetase TilS [Solirubrobacteraceae bacterium]
MIVEQVRAAVRDAGLLGGKDLSTRPVVAMLSGGRDSVCLLDVAVALREPSSVKALHVNYGLRGAESDADERHCAALCETLGVGLEVVRASREEGVAGNLQAWAREVRYAAAIGLAERLDEMAEVAAAAEEAGPAEEAGATEEAERSEGFEDARGAARTLVAAGHTASDQVETILYRLAASPGRRALLGMRAAEGRLVRPLLGVTREQTGAYCEARGLRWREDASNDSDAYARGRVRHGLGAALRAVHPAAEANVLRTAELLREETDLLDGLVGDTLGGRQSIEIARLEALERALARLVVVRLAEQAAGTYVPQAGDRVQEIIELSRRGAAPGGGRLDLHVGGNVSARIEDGVLSMVRLPRR